MLKNLNGFGDIIQDRITKLGLKGITEGVWIRIKWTLKKQRT